MRSILIAGGLTLLAVAAQAADARAADARAADPQPGDSGRGRELYEARCTGCHSIEASRVGPMHRGVFGRKAGSVADFAYSPAVKGSSVVWGEETLDRWLTDPQKLIPGQRMNFRVTTPADRADIIAFLKSDAAR